MLYPNNIKKTYKKEISHKNRGMSLEYLIEQENTYYRDNDIAYIYKKPTPIRVVKTEYCSYGKRITDAFYEMPSTLDFPNSISLAISSIGMSLHMKTFLFLVKTVPLKKSSSPFFISSRP